MPRTESKGRRPAPALPVRSGRGPILRGLVRYCFATQGFTHRFGLQFVADE